MRVRLATPQDAPALMRLCRALHDESGVRDGADKALPFSDARVMQMIERAVRGSRSDVVCAVIGPVGGELEGSLLLELSQTWYSEAPVFRDIWNYVAPAHRDGRHAEALFAFAKGLAGAARMPLVMNVMSTRRQAAKVRWFRRKLGMPPLGAVFVYNAEHGTV